MRDLLTFLRPRARRVDVLVAALLLLLGFALAVQVPTFLFALCGIRQEIFMKPRALARSV